MLDITPGTVLADRYTIGEQLGVGGTGVVWQARDGVLRRDVALKVVRNGEHARLEREARAAAGVNDRNVVAVYDAGQDGHTVFLVMELVPGVDLGQVVRVCGALPPQVVALLGRDLATGLGAVHEAGIIHRDIKPSNVLLTDSGVVKLGDLGIARTSDATSTVRLTETGTIVGTIDYLAPEQLAEHEITPATDVYAVGLLLLECCTGEKPFGEGTLAERAARRLTRSPEPPSGVHSELRDAIVIAVERDPDDRPQDGLALADVLAGAVADEDAARAELQALIERTAAAPPEERNGSSHTPSTGSGSVDVATVAFTPDNVQDTPPRAAAGTADPAAEPAAQPTDGPTDDPTPESSGDPAAEPTGDPAPAAAAAAAPAPTEDTPAPTAAADARPAREDDGVPAMGRLLLEAIGLAAAIALTIALASAIVG